MTIIQFFKIVFGGSRKEPQDLTQQSNLDIANVQPASEEFVTAAEEPLSPVVEQTTEGSLDILATESQEPVHEATTSTEESTDVLKDFVNEIDKEYSAGTALSAGFNIENVDTDVVEQEQDPAKEITSLLDNTPYMSLADSCCNLVKELEKLKTKENQELIEQVVSRIKEGLLSSGAEPIAEETSYNVIRHIAIGKSIVRKGTPITSTIEPGVTIDDKVMIKAKVQI